jgi:cellobiose phosphorylase
LTLRRLGEAARERLGRLDDPDPHARLLSNGHFTVLVTGAGTGRSWWGDVALTAWAGDPVTDTDSFSLYLRDLDHGTVWSLGWQPVPGLPARYAVEHRPGVLAISRHDHAIEASLEVTVVPEADVELRVVRVWNRANVARRLELTTCLEVVLHEAAAHASHPAFSKLFVETAWDEAVGALLAHRRPRSSGERTGWMVHALAGPGPLERETDRARFVGRGRSLARARALESMARLSGAVGNVLDPVLALRRTVELAPGAGATFVAALGAAAEADAALALAARWADADAAAAALALAGAHERARRARLGLDDATAEGLQALAGALLYRHPALRAAALRIAGGVAPGPAAEVALVAGRPALVVDADDAEACALLPALVAGMPYWCDLGLAPSLLVLGHDPPALEGDGVHFLRRDAVAPDALARLCALAAGGIEGSLAAVAGEEGPAAPPPVARPVEFVTGHAEPPLAGPGGFTADGREYRLRLDAPGARPPMPWVNVLANDTVGCLVSESGAACTWSRNSREHRLTPWSNDPVCDPHDEALWVRDEDAGVFWSPLPGPIPAGAHEVAHGFGYTLWRHRSRGLEQTVRVFVPIDDPVRVVAIRLENLEPRPRRLALVSYARLVLGADPADAARAVTTAWDAEHEALLARNPLAGDFADGLVFAAAIAPAPAAAPGFTADRTAFLGRGGSPARPAALCAGGGLDGRTGTGLEPCAALQLDLVLAPGEAVECAFLLGEVTDAAPLWPLLARWRAPGAVARALAEVEAAWRRTLEVIQVETPVRAIDLMMNGWLLYQALAGRVRGRTGFYQSSGAFGFRDQLQDASALVYARPELTRAQLLLHAAHQFPEGDVLHWWHPPRSRGMRTRCSDDLLWLPWMAAFYVDATGERSVLDERVGFVAAAPLAPGEDEAYLLPDRAPETATLYEHCARAIDRSLTRGAHGLPLIGTGDWNDGMNRVGSEGRGESVWLGFFLHQVLGAFIPLAVARGESERVERWRGYRAALGPALEDAWDGAWYRRAYYDDGTPLGSAAADECRIDVLAQAWAVLSGAVSRPRAAEAMEAVVRELVDADAGLVRLLAPPFDRTPHDPGYIKGYVPGIRENGGQYTHAACWAVRAMAELGWHDRAARLLERLTPVWHGARTDLYAVEPYVVAADIYGAPPHIGRGGWTWYTGSAAWLYRVALESVLGVTLEGGAMLRVRPCVPDDWPGYTVRLRRPDGSTWTIEVRNPDGCAEAVRAVSVDDAAATVEDGAARVPLVADGRAHCVTVTLGRRA